MKNRIKPLIIAILLSSVVFINFCNITQKEMAIHEDEERSFALKKVSLYSERIESMIITGVNYASFYEFFLSQNQANPEEEFMGFAERIMSIEEEIDSVSLAPDGLVTMVYPSEGNEAAIGHNLLSDERRRPFVEKAIEERTSVTQGPINAKQGGIKIFNRKPIYIIEEEKENFWGLISVGIDFNELIEKPN